MADIELVVKLSSGHYEALKQMADVKLGHYFNAILNGTPLPKGHGRIGDLDKLIQTMKERNDDNGGEPLNAVDRGYDLAYQHMVKEAEECVIIGADTESEDKNG